MAAVMSNRPKLPKQANYDVGYGKPPKSTRFQKGQSGNPKGRPKGVPNQATSKLEKFRDIILQEANRLVPVTENGKTTKISVWNTFIRSLSLQAMQAKTVGSMKLFHQIVQAAEEDQSEALERETAKQLTELSDAYEYKMRMENELYREKKGEIKLIKKPLPHPDNVVIDEANMRVEIRGPYNDMTKNLWDKQIKLKRNAEEELVLLHEDLANPEEADNRAFIEEQIAKQQNFLDSIDLKLMTLWKMLPKQLSNDPDRQDELVELLEMHYLEAGEDMPWWFMFYV